MNHVLFTLVLGATFGLLGTLKAQETMKTNESFTVADMSAFKSHNSNPWGLVYTGAITENAAGKVNIHPITYDLGGLKIAANVYTPYCRAAGGGNSSKETTETVSEQRAESGANPVSGKSLVVYFSVPETDGVDASSGASRVLSGGKVMGNTQYVAAIIGEATGSDLLEIKTVRTYPGSHKALIDAAKVEIDNNARPELATHIANLNDYDVVFVGFPNWWYDMPMPLYTFFDTYDFSGKTVIPFCTHGGSRFSGAIKTIRELEPGATVLDGYAVARDRVADSKNGVLKWLEKIGMNRVAE